MTTIVAAAGGGNWTSSGTWVGGVAPTAADDAQLASTSGNVTITSGSVCRSLDCTGYTGTLSINGLTFTIGDGTAGASSIALKLSSGMTLTLAGSALFKFVSTSATQQSITSAGKTLPAVTFDGVGGSWQLADGMTVGGPGSLPTLTLTNGSLDLAGQTCSFGRFFSNNSNTRSLTLGAASISLTETAVATLWNTATTTGLTFSGTSATITIANASASDRAFSGGGLTFGALVYTVAGSTGALSISGANSFSTISFSDASNARTLTLPAGVTTTFRQSFHVDGTSGKKMTIQSSSGGSAATLLKTFAGKVSCDYLTLTDSAATLNAAGDAYWYAGANSNSTGVTSGWIMSAPPVSYGSMLALL